jgi:hypothetical protein
MPRRAVPGLAFALPPANVKDPGGKMSTDYSHQFAELDMSAPELAHPPPKNPEQPAAGSYEGQDQEKYSVMYDPAGETWDSAWETPEPANVKDPGGKMSTDYSHQFAELDMSAPELAHPPPKNPEQPAAGSYEGQDQEKYSVMYDPAGETWYSAWETPEPDAGGE